MKFLYTILLLSLSINIFAQSKELPTKSKLNCGSVSETNKIKQMENQLKIGEKNVLGTELKIASTHPLTGFYRNGFCSTGIDDRGVHVVAAIVTKEFLAYSKAQGNDLITPYPASDFPGLKPGDTWCLCAKRWKEAYIANVAPPVILEATHAKALEFITLEELSNVIKK